MIFLTNIFGKFLKLQKIKKINTHIIKQLAQEADVFGVVKNLQKYTKKKRRNMIQNYGILICHLMKLKWN